MSNKGVKQDKPKEQKGPLSDEQVRNLSPILQRMYLVMTDGQTHTREELWVCLDDDQAPIRNIYNHVVKLRQILCLFKYDLVFRDGKYRLSTWDPTLYGG